MKKTITAVLMIFLLASRLYLSAGGSQNNSNPDSNNAVVSRILPQGQNKTSFLVYKTGNSLAVDFYNYKNQDNKYEKVTTKTIEGVQIQKDTKYKTGIINREILLFTNRRLYKAEIPDVVTGDTALQRTVLLAEKLQDVIFYDNNCFYITEEGTIFRYDGESHPYEIQLDVKQPGNNGIPSFSIITAEQFTSISRGAAEEWFNKFFQSLLARPDREISKDDERNVKKYLEINGIINELSHSTAGNELNDIKTWREQYLKKELAAFEKEKAALQKELPSGAPFPGEINLDASSIRNIKIIDKRQYGGGDRDILFLIDINNKLNDTYSKLKRGNILSNATERLLESNYKIISGELVTLLKKEKEKLDRGNENYNKRVNDIEAEFEKRIRDNLKSIRLTGTSYPMRKFDYVFLPPQDTNGGYALFYKTITSVEDAGISEFQKIGQDVKLIGISDKYVYACEEGKLILYNPFEMSVLKSLSYETDPKKNEKFLFAVDQEKGIFVTKNELKNERNIVSMTIDDKGKPVFSNPRLETGYSNGGALKNFHAPFYSAITDNGYIYINNLKSKITEGIKTESGYIYGETSSGSGIIQRRQR